MPAQNAARMKLTRNYFIINGLMAEGEGFEPPEPLRVQWFSRPSKGGRGTSPSQLTPMKTGILST